MRAKHDGGTSVKEQDATEDACVGGSLLVWHMYRGAVVWPFEKRGESRMLTHWREMPKSGWTDAAERKPTPEDADIRGCVLAKHEFDGIRVTGWHQFGWNRHLTHWIRTPEPPRDAKQYEKNRSESE